MKWYTIRTEFVEGRFMMSLYATAAALSVAIYYTGGVA